MLISESWGVTRRAPTDLGLVPWEQARVCPVSESEGRHTSHAYFNVPPESPDGCHVLFFASEDPAGERGELVVRERATGRETTIARGLVTEDAHRAACQQWVDGGRAVAYHDCRDGRWVVVAVDLATLTQRVLAEDRQLGFGAAMSPWVPVYGCHWNPGPHRDLELVHAGTGEVRTAVRTGRIVADHGDWARATLGEGPVSIFFPVLSPDASRVFFKLACGRGGADFRSWDASRREGKFVFDVRQDRLLRVFPKWGHPSWHPDNRRVFEKGNLLQDVETGAEQQLAMTPSDHPSFSPDGRLFTSDANVSGRDFGKVNEWAVLVARPEGEGFVVVHQFDNSGGATSWRRPHPHPVFSADSRRLYYNINEGPWTRLFVAEALNRQP